MYTHEEITALEKRIIALEEECEILAKSAFQFCNLAEEMLQAIDPSPVRMNLREKYYELHATKRGPTSAEALLEFARRKSYEGHYVDGKEGETYQMTSRKLVNLEDLEEWVIEEKVEF